jgi:hypothetical protein
MGVLLLRDLRKVFNTIDTEVDKLSTEAISKAWPVYPNPHGLSSNAANLSTTVVYQGV